MRKIKPVVWLITLFVFGLQTDQALADVFASQIRVTNPDDSPFDGSFSDGSSAKINFFLNDTANVVTILIKDAETGTGVAQIDAGAMSRGRQSVDWDGSGGASGKRYVVEITAEQTNRSTDGWTVFYDSGDIDIFTRGVAVVTNQTDPNFGLIFASNDGGPLQTGINIFNPDGSFHDPFLVAADVFDGGTIEYGSDAPVFAILDYNGELLVSLKDKGQVMRIARDFTESVVIDGITSPKGLYVEGSGEDFMVYVVAENKIMRGNLGTAGSIDPTNLETIAEFSSFFPQQIILDDEGFLYVTLRQFDDLSSDGRGIRKYDLSGTLPVTDNDALWFLGEEKTFIANDLLLDHGDDPGSALDDILYYSTRAGGGFNQDGIWRIDDINSFFPDTVRVITEDDFYGIGSDSNVNTKVTFDFDAAGNIIFMENANEHVFFISPPGTGETNSFTTIGADTVAIAVAVNVEDIALSSGTDAYELHQNYPNPFNPETSIRFLLETPEIVQLGIYNLKGQLIRTLIDSELKQTGRHQIEWNGRNDSGRPVASGRYVYVLTSEKFRLSKIMTLSR